MPLYDYQCPSCGPITALRPLREHSEPLVCPDCAEPAPRVMLTAPHISGLSADRHVAYARNERARHEPLRCNFNDEPQARSKSAHPFGCACCSGSGIRSGTAVTRNGEKTFPRKRPWMISH